MESPHAWTQPIPFPMPIAAVIAFSGGVVAQATPTTTVGAAGLIVSVTGLTVALFQYFKAYLDYRQMAKQIEGLSAELSVTRTDLADSRKRRHDDANRLNSLLIDQQLKIANLEGLLGKIDRSHVEAIDINADNIGLVADRTGVKLPNKTPHLDPITEPEPEPDTYLDPKGRLIHEPPSDR